MKIEKAIDLCKKQVSCFETDCMAECVGCPNESSPDDFKDALQLIIIPVLQEKQEREHPQPLTLEQMISIAGSPERDCTTCRHEDCDEPEENCSTCENWKRSESIGLSDYGRTWLAYAHKPKEEK